MCRYGIIRSRTFLRNAQVARLSTPPVSGTLRSTRSAIGSMCESRGYRRAVGKTSDQTGSATALGVSRVAAAFAFGMHFQRIARNPFWTHKGMAVSRCRDRHLGRDVI